MPNTLSITATVGIDDVDLEHGEVVGFIDPSVSSRSEFRVPIEDVLGWTGRREDRRIEEYHRNTES